MGVEQHKPATSGGIHNGFPARSESATSASGKDGEAGPSGSRPNIRLMQAGKYTAAAPFFSVDRGARPARGIGPGTLGIRSGLTIARATPVKAVSGFSPNREEKACVAERVTFDTFLA